MLGTIIHDNVNAGGTAIFIREHILPDHASVTHDITCQGRDHIVRIQSGESVLVIINVHFEPDLILRNLRERLRRIPFHWPRYPEGLGMIIVDFNICEPEEGNFSVKNQTFTEGDAGRTPQFRTFFPHAREIAQPNFARKDTAADGALRTLFRIDGAFKKCAHGSSVHTE